MRPEHKPIGDPCIMCACPAMRHLVPHRPQGDPCASCGLPAANHRARTAEEVANSTAINRARGGTRVRRKKPKGPRVVYGLDGEGQGRRPHRYVHLCAAPAVGPAFLLEDPAWGPAWDAEHSKSDETRLTGLRTEACLDFLLSLPENALIFAFAFGYDLSKILEDVDNETLWLLCRPDEHPRKNPKAQRLGPRPLLWRGYLLNLQGTHFTVQKGDVTRDVWDLFKFYGCKFTQALADWKVGTEGERYEIEKMKAQRGVLDQVDPDRTRAYCLSECRQLATMGQKLIDAHIAVELPLKVFHGPGSTAGAMLKKMGIMAHIEAQKDTIPREMAEAIARAFFGGRFEHSAIGPIECEPDEPLEGWDISSAYPYHMVQLPCLIHGKWRLTQNRADVDSAAHALVRYRLEKKPGCESPIDLGAWGPFPYRFPEGSEEEGSICFPAMSGGGWVYKAEYEAGEDIFPEVQFVEAWVYEKACDCQPFAQIAHYYLWRIQLGKEGPGITVKLGVNSGYGKCAQSVGNAPFNCWLWAGMITSGCRAQILRMMGLHRDPRNLLMVATDGIVTRERLQPPKPIPTGTDILLDGSPPDAAGKDGKNKKPLGGWEKKVWAQGIFLARPGIYFPLHLGAEGTLEDEEAIKRALKEIKGRGVGKAVLLRHYHDLIRAWVFTRGREKVTVTKVERFCGMKTSIHRSGKKGAYKFSRADGTQESLTGAPPSYGQWVERPVELSFDPLPKRERIADDGVTLVLRWLDPAAGESAPYDAAVKSKEALELKAFADEMGEQADFNLEEMGGMFTEEMGL